MAKIFDWLKPTSNPNTNAFDVSRRDTFSTSSGILNCPRPRLVSPKSKGRLRVTDSIINTLGMVNQPFNRGQFVLDFYQVPLQQIMSDFNAFYTQLDEELDSSAYNPFESRDLPQIPHLDLWTLIGIIGFDMVNYFIITESFDSSDNKFRFLWFESKEELFGARYNRFIQDSFLGVDVHGIPNFIGVLRLLDQLGYGNFYLFLKDVIVNLYSYPVSSPDFERVLRDFVINLMLVYFYDSYVEGDDVSDEFADSYTSIETTFENLVGNSEYNAAFHEFNSWQVTVSPSPKYCVNALKFFAYQKVFEDIYRNSFYDKIPSIAYNADFFVNNAKSVGFCEILYEITRLNNGAFPHGDNANNYFPMLWLRYRQFKKDMFTSLLPNSQFGEVSMVNVGDSVFNLSQVLPNGDIKPLVNLANRGGVTVDGGVDQSPLNLTSSSLSFSVLMSRRAEALQRYKERYLRAGNRIKDQYVSTFGKVPYYLNDRYVRYLGSIDTRLAVQGVPATSDTGEYNVGDRGAYGYSGIGGQIDFACDDWSYIVPIFYYLPELDYEAFGIEADGKFSEFTDFIVPEFENLGLEPVYRSTLSALRTFRQDDLQISGERVIGYGPSYMYYKTDIDRLHGEFGNTGDLPGVFANWVTSRGNVSMADLSDYYVSPRFDDSIFRTKFNGSQSNDHYLCVLNFDFKLIEPLSVVGLPIWS